METEAVSGIQDQAPFTVSGRSLQHGKMLEREARSIIQDVSKTTFL